MKIGRRKKTDLMKQFILETLQKGRVEGNCLTIHKGTAQYNYSPKREEERPARSQERHPLVLVQQQSHRRLPNRRPGQPNVPLNRPRPIQKGEHKTSVNLSSRGQNSKWVEMARGMELRVKKEEEAVIE
jgi:hypothetical protein